MQISKLTPEEKAKKYGGKKLEIGGRIFNSLSEAAREFGVVRETIAHRIRSKNPKYSSYKFI